MKILVVDDEEDVREIITEFIVENFDISVLEASTGMEAINCLEGEKDIGLIIADYNFPDLGDGGVNGGGIYTFNLGNENIPFFLLSIGYSQTNKFISFFFFYTSSDREGINSISKNDFR